MCHISCFPFEFEQSFKATLLTMDENGVVLSSGVSGVGRASSDSVTSAEYNMAFYLLMERWNTVSGHKHSSG